MLKHTIFSLLACGLVMATESFDQLPGGKITGGDTVYGKLSAEAGHAEITKGKGKALPEYLDEEVFGGVKGSTLAPDPADVEGYEVFYDRYTKGLPIERAAVDSLV